MLAFTASGGARQPARTPALQGIGAALARSQRIKTSAQRAFGAAWAHSRPIKTPALRGGTTLALEGPAHQAAFLAQLDHFLRLRVLLHALSAPAASISQQRREPLQLTAWLVKEVKAVALVRAYAAHRASMPHPIPSSASSALPIRTARWARSCKFPVTLAFTPPLAQACAAAWDTTLLLDSLHALHAQKASSVWSVGQKACPRARRAQRGPLAAWAWLRAAFLAPFLMLQVLFNACLALQGDMVLPWAPSPPTALACALRAVGALQARQPWLALVSAMLAIMALQKPCAPPRSAMALVRLALWGPWAGIQAAAALVLAPWEITAPLAALPPSLAQRVATAAHKAWAPPCSALLAPVVHTRA